MALVCPPEWILFQDLQNNKYEVFPYKNSTLATLSNFFVCKILQVDWEEGMHHPLVQSYHLGSQM
jgi:hypothetical protein